jgi:hypothetical protein
MPETLSCYGGLFPETLVKAPNQDVKGRVFGYRLDHHGVVESGLTVTTDRDAGTRARRARSSTAATASPLAGC